jgi:hypothetical protein
MKHVAPSTKTHTVLDALKSALVHFETIFVVTRSVNGIPVHLFFEIRIYASPFWLNRHSQLDAEPS